MDLTKLYREAKLPRFMHDSDNGREALARLVGVVLEQAAKAADGAQANRTACANIAATIRAMKPTSL